MYMYIYMQVYIYYVRPHLVVPTLHSMGGIKCQPLLKHSNHWKQALNNIQGKHVL